MSDHDARLILLAIELLREDVADLTARLRGIELWKARIEGAQWAAGRLPTLIACLAGIASTVAVAVALAN